MPALDRALYVGSVRMLVSDCRIGAGMGTNEGDRMVSARPGMGVGMDWRRLSKASSDGTFPVDVIRWIRRTE